MMWWHKYLVIFTVLVKCSVAEYLHDSCIPNAQIQDGVCSLITDCDVALRELRSKRRHSFYRCGFSDFIEIVCCPRMTAKFGEPRIADRECEKIREHSIPSLAPYIIGGEEAEVGEFPHMAALGYERNGVTDFDCGGSILSKNFVLTAAHCVDTLERIQPTVIRAGTIDVSDSSWNDETDVRIAEIIKHPNYTRQEQYNDLCLLRLERPLKFNNRLNAICLYTDVEDPMEKVTVTGWGQISNRRVIKSSVLLKANLTVVSIAQCGETFTSTVYRKLPRGITTEMLCAGDPKGISDACQGDSGGPLQLSESDGHQRLVGVVAFGKGCGSPVPGVYTRVAAYLPWIESVVWGH